jgi:hypothetical protein
MSNQQEKIVREWFGIVAGDTCITVEKLNSLLLESQLIRRISVHADHTTIIISFTLVLLRRIFYPNYSRPNRIIRMIMKRIFKILRTNISAYECQNSSDRIPHREWKHLPLQPHKGILQFRYAVDEMLLPCLRGEISLSFPELVHVLSIIRFHIGVAYNNLSPIMVELLMEDELRGWEARFDCSWVYDANENLEEFLQRFSYFIEHCCFYFLMQTRRTFSQLQ